MCWRHLRRILMAHISHSQEVLMVCVNHDQGVLLLPYSSFHLKIVVNHWSGNDEVKHHQWMRVLVRIKRSVFTIGCLPYRRHPSGTNGLRRRCYCNSQATSEAEHCKNGASTWQVTSNHGMTLFTHCTVDWSREAEY